jgi:hypothetical protein
MENVKPANLSTVQKKKKKKKDIHGPVCGSERLLSLSPRLLTFNLIPQNNHQWQAQGILVKISEMFDFLL